MRGRGRAELVELSRAGTLHAPSARMKPILNGSTLSLALLGLALAGCASSSSEEVDDAASTALALERRIPDLPVGGIEKEPTRSPNGSPTIKELTMLECTKLGGTASRDP